MRFITSALLFYYDGVWFLLFMFVLIRSKYMMEISLCRLLPVAVFLWNRPTKGYLGVCMFLQSYANLKDAVASRKIKNLDIQRLVVRLCSELC